MATRDAAKRRRLVIRTRWSPVAARPRNEVEITRTMAGTEALSASEVRRLVRERKIEHVVVLGANGTMGYGSAALFTQAVPKVTFLARTKEKAEQGLAAAIKQVRSPTVADASTCGSYDADLASSLATADLVFEALTEDLELKREMFDAVEKHRRDDAIVATVTSGLSINELCAGRGESFRRHFLGLHFFNPPNVIVGTELIAGDDTHRDVVDFVEAFARFRLGREIVRTYDTPAFAGNRVGFKVLNECAQLAEEHGPHYVDTIVGPYTGRALTPLATVDLVGWDIHKAIVDNVFAKCDDEARATNRIPTYMDALIAKGVLGDKTKGGFFKRDGKLRLALDVASGTYKPVAEIALPELGYIAQVSALHHQGRYAEGMSVFASAPGPHAKRARKVIAGYVAYAFARVGEVTDSIDGIDRIMGAGFNWAPPSVLVDVLTPRTVVAMIEEAKLEVPEALVRLAKPKHPKRLFRAANVNIGKYFVAA